MVGGRASEAQTVPEPSRSSPKDKETETGGPSWCFALLDAEVAAFEGGAELGVEGAEGPGVGVSEEEGVVV